MSEREDREDAPKEDGYVETSNFGFDHPNVKLMDNQFLVTMNNEHIKRGYIAKAEVPIVKAEVRVMGALERLYAGPYYAVDTARAIDAGAFTLERAIESATDGFFVRLEHSQYNYDLMMPPAKQGGFLSKLNPFRREEQPAYVAEPRR